ncbi:MAG: DNA-directed RNA polymerase subunit H [Candidatus Altiarchaeota archaeon]|nr:DNA-directed RNA polymerase subunit H [Candidatus Altiarchaeota archaeon]
MGVSKKIKEHNLVPKHKVLTKEQIDKIIEKFGIKKWQLPKLLDKDPVVLLAGARPGDVLKIDRISETAGESTYYRLVVRSGN